MRALMIIYLLGQMQRMQVLADGIERISDNTLKDELREALQELRTASGNLVIMCDNTPELD